MIECLNHYIIVLVTCYSMAIGDLKEMHIDEGFLYKSYVYLLIIFNYFSHLNNSVRLASTLKDLIFKVQGYKEYGQNGEKSR